MQKPDDAISYILQENILSSEKLEELLHQQNQTGKNLINLLKETDLVNEEQLTKITAIKNKIEFVNLSPDMVDPMAAHLVSYEMVSQHCMIPIKKEGDKLSVAMSSPLNLAVRDQIEKRTGCRVLPFAATESAIKRTIKYHFSVRNVTKQAIVSMRLKQDQANETSSNSENQETLPKVSDDPITKLVSSIIIGAIDDGASDIHIEPQEPDMRVRYRVDGIGRNAIDVPSSVQKEVVSRIKILADMDISEKRLPQDGHITIQHDNKDYDLRVSSLPSVGGEKIVLRILDKSNKNWSLDNIVSSESDQKKLKDLVKNPYGMLLLTGPTGSGKTTTLYSVLQLLNRPEKNIVTVEDPVEYRLEGITQVQVKPGIGMSFASALKSILRQDPDIILIGEIRDLETAEIAVSAALTGHLVLSTLHTNDAAGAISRLINLGVAPFLVASSLLGTVAQRLIRTTCPKCKKEYSPAGEELALLNGQIDTSAKLYKSVGCDFCFHSGYHKRKAIYEILGISKQIRKMIIDRSSTDAVKQQGISEGMKTLRQSGLDLVLSGQSTFEELLRVVDMGAD